jgi:cyclic 2,3-diphosphoglycerate synthetase
MRPEGSGAPVARGLKAIALVDGEHYPEVTLAALRHIEEDLGYELVAIAFLGGTEKVAAPGGPSYRGLPVHYGDTPLEAVRRAVEGSPADVVLDLSDEPVVGYAQRFRLVSETLARGISYRGADFSFDAPARPFLCDKPSIGVWGTGKRVGKTSVCGYAARHLAQGGKRPCICTMGRGGPSEPELLDVPSDITDAYLRARVEEGRHAASDHFEDAMMAGVVTVGCRRCGGGMAGEPFLSNVASGAALACAQEADMILFEGSGSAIPPAGVDAVMLVAGAALDEQNLLGYLGPYRLLLSDLLVVTMCEDFLVSSDKLRKLIDGALSINPEVKVVKTVFRPRPLADVRGRKVYLVSTSPDGIAGSQADHLAGEHGAVVVGYSPHLANRPRLTEDLESAREADVLVTELKAAGVDTVSLFAKENDKEIVYLENVPVGLDGASLAEEIDRLAGLAQNRALRR